MDVSGGVGRRLVLPHWIHREACPVRPSRSVDFHEVDQTVLCSQSIDAASMMLTSGKQQVNTVQIIITVWNSKEAGEEGVTPGLFCHLRPVSASSGITQPGGIPSNLSGILRDWPAVPKLH